jgi:hypothetical protein
MVTIILDWLFVEQLQPHQPHEPLNLWATQLRKSDMHQAADTKSFRCISSAQENGLILDEN